MTQSLIGVGSTKQFTLNLVPALELISTTNRETGARHYALPDGTVYPSVTTILSELPNKGLAAWRKRVGDAEAEKISKRASDRGSTLHEAVNTYLMNGTPVVEQPIVKYLYNQVRPTLNAIDNIRLMESPLYSHRLRMAGKPDCIANWKDQLSVIDLKTSTKVKLEKYINSYYCQVAAYAIMFEELYGERPEQGVIVVATEDAPLPSVFKKSIKECFALLTEYVKKLDEYRRSKLKTT